MGFCDGSVLSPRAKVPCDIGVGLEIVQTGTPLELAGYFWRSTVVISVRPVYTLWWYVVHSEERLRQLPPALRGHVTDLSSFRGRLCALALLHAGNCLLGCVCTDSVCLCICTSNLGAFTLHTRSGCNESLDVRGWLVCLISEPLLPEWETRCQCVR